MSPIRWALILAAAYCLNRSESISETAQEFVFPASPFPRDPVEAFAQRIKSQVASVDLTQLSEMTTARDDAVAIAAQWEILRRSVPRADSRVPRPAAEHFLGFVEGRLRVDLPVEFEDVLKTAMFGNGGFLFTEVSNTQSRETLVIGNKTFVALHGTIGAYEFLRLDSATKEEKWRSTVWAHSPYDGGAILDAFHNAYVLHRDDEVVVAGITDSICYLEVYSQETGDNFLRFNSGFLQPNSFDKDR